VKLTTFAVALAQASSVSGAALAADENGPRNAISVHPFSLLAHGVALQYERYVSPRRFSLVLAAGFRSSSRGDYSSWVTTVGVEPRVWLARAERPRHLGRDAMVGPYLGVRGDAAWLAMTDTTRNAWVGGNMGLSLVGSFGWRFTVSVVELTPSFGVGARTDIDPTGRLAAWVRPVYRLDWTVGWMF
jgi:hypothetical protein